LGLNLRENAIVLVGGDAGSLQASVFFPKAVPQLRRLVLIFLFITKQKFVERSEPDSSPTSFWGVLSESRAAWAVLLSRRVIAMA
jgi:hypothetical protein